MKKIGNRTLLIVFCILAAIAVIIYFYDKNKGEKTFRTDLFTVDSAKVTAITIYPKGKPDGSIKLAKNGKNWEVLSNRKTYPADTATIQRLISALLNVKAERVAGNDKFSWKELEISDSASTRVVVEQNKEVAADFRLGKISFPRDNTANPNGRNQNLIVKSHIRVAGDEKVYVVDGFLSMMFGDRSSAYRNKMVYRFDKKMVEKLTFTYPGDSSFSLEKNGTRWLLNRQPADSAKVETYLNNTANTTSIEFAEENITAPVLYPFLLKMEGNNMPSILASGATGGTPEMYFVKSTVNPAEVFGSSNPGLFNRIFPGKGKFETEKGRKQKK
ncbi:MAG: DUF4340 domain-containing protein [Bacteroidota bacterium]